MSSYLRKGFSDYRILFPRLGPIYFSSYANNNNNNEALAIINGNYYMSMEELSTAVNYGSECHPEFVITFQTRKWKYVPFVFETRKFTQGVHYEDLNSIFIEAMKNPPKFVLVDF